MRLIEWAQAQIVRLYTRRCHGCADPSPHSPHLTWLGHRRYT